MLLIPIVEKGAVKEGCIYNTVLGIVQCETYGNSSELCFT